MKFSGKIGNGPVNQWLNFGGSPVHCLDTGIVFQIRHCWEIRKTLSTHCTMRRCSAGHALAGIAKSNYDVIISPAHDRQPWQACLSGGMRCLSASSFVLFSLQMMFVLGVQSRWAYSCSVDRLQDVSSKDSQCQWERCVCLLITWCPVLSRFCLLLCTGLKPSHTKFRSIIYYKPKGMISARVPSQPVFRRIG